MKKAMLIASAVFAVGSLITIMNYAAGEAARGPVVGPHSEPPPVTRLPDIEPTVIRVDPATGLVFVGVRNNAGTSFQRDISFAFWYKGVRQPSRVKTVIYATDKDEDDPGLFDIKDFPYDEGPAVVTVQVDGTGDVKQSNETNNILTTRFPIFLP